MGHEYKQGIYKPTNKAKCVNKAPVVYRSWLEARLFRFLDNSPSVLEWGSEVVVIPYFKSIENRMARYYMDVYAKMKIGENVKKFLIEVKPHKFTLPPVPGRKAMKTVIYENTQWSINQDKWKFAQKWAEMNKYEFMIITEKNIEKLEGRK